MAKHTPGPWVDSITMGRSEKGVVGEAFAWMGRGPVIVATRPIQEGEHMYNAKLMAAAPDMLEALKNVLTLAVLKWGNLDPEANTAFDHARAAIAKAEGKTE